MLIVVPKSHVGACKFGQGTKWCTASKQNNYFDSYYKKGILYRVLQKNDNYKELFSNFQMNNKLVSDIENLSKVSINLRRKENSTSMVDKVDYAYGNKSTLEFLNSLPSEGYKAIKNYQSLNEQNIKTIIREEINDFDWAKDVQTNHDIAKDIVNKTKFWMSDSDLRVDLPFMSYHKGYSAKQLFKSSSLLKQKSPTIMFLEFVKENYGFERTDYMAHSNINPNVSDIWFRYKNLITQKVLNNLKNN
jgi:hypothetical protein